MSVKVASSKSAPVKTTSLEDGQLAVLTQPSENGKVCQRVGDALVFLGWAGTCFKDHFTSIYVVGFNCRPLKPGDTITYRGYSSRHSGKCAQADPKKPTNTTADLKDGQMAQMHNGKVVIRNGNDLRRVGEPEDSGWSNHYPCFRPFDCTILESGDTLEVTAN